MRTQKETRKGCCDVWNAYMVKGATFSTNDIPLCPCAVTASPKSLISYEEARLIYNRQRQQKNYDFYVDAFVHFYLDDQKFDGPVSGIWHAPMRAWEILRHFAGIITPDFSTYADFPYPIKIYNTYRMRAFGYWYGQQGGAVINNVRWGTSETYAYTFDGIPPNSIIAIGTVASGLRELKNRSTFEQGFYKLLEMLSPHTIVVYGSDKYSCFDSIRSEVNIIAFSSETSMAFRRGKR